MTCENKEKKSAIITGGGGFIGRCIAKRFSKEGYALVLCDFNLETAQNVADEIIADGGQAIAIQTNVKEYDDACIAVNKSIEAYGKVDQLVCVAGGSTRDKMCYFCDQDKDVILDNVGVNLIGTMLFTHAVSKHMADRKSGNIIFISSVLGSQGSRRSAEYSAAKGGVITFTKALAMEMAEFGVRVNCVSPGLVERGTEDVSNTNYIGRNCTGDEIANAVAFLASDEASFVIGHNLVVDGGWGLGVQSGVKPGRH